MLRKIILFLTPLLVLTILFLLIVLIINRDNGKGAFKASSTPSSQVFLNGKYVGKTPLCLCELAQLLKTGEYDVKLVPTTTDLSSMEQKITIYKGVLTVLDKTFDKNTSAGTQSLITLEPIDNENSSEILIVSFPDKARVVLDSNTAGQTPLLLKNITASDHEIQLLKDGYQEKDLKIKTVAGKRLDITATLGIKNNINEKPATSSPAAQVTKKVVILSTPTGYLRVRAEASVSSSQVGTVNPGDSLSLVSEKDGWYEIELTDGKTGWVSSDYAKKE